MDETPLALVEARMEQLCQQDPLGAVVWEHVSAGGKRIRARLAMQSVAALGGDALQALSWGVACELLHNASLIHDDIQDGDRYRRGRPAIWARYGMAQAINAGDLCIALAYQAIESMPVSESLCWALTKAVTRRSRSMVCGQADEFRLLLDGAPTWEAYDKAVSGKTSALFSLPIEGAALIAGRSAQEAQQLANCCHPFGLLFQIQDDVLDLYGNNGRDVPGSDLAQPGKASALVVEHLRLHPDERAGLLAVLAASRHQTQPDAIARVIADFSQRGALLAVWQRIDAIRQALDDSAELRQEPALHALLQTFVDKVLQPILHTRQPQAVAVGKVCKTA
jgi:geranylgeranyl diphosphate synthase type I